jgi:hypothetical protein
MSDTNTEEGAAFEPRPMSEVLRSDPAPTREEPAGRPEPTAAPQTTSDPGEKPAPQADRNRDDAGRFAPKGEQQGAPPASEQNAPQMVPVSAVLEERKKRQALEARIREFEAAPRAPAPAQQMPQQPAQPEVPLSDLMFQDPDRFIQAVRAPLEEQLVMTRIAMSEQVARREPDYADAEAALTAYVEQNPAVRPHVAKALREHPAPAMWALEQGRMLLAQQRWGQVIQQYGSPDAYLAAVQQQQPPAPASRAPAAPPPPASLASVRSSGPRSSGLAPWSGPKSLFNTSGRR